MIRVRLAGPADFAALDALQRSNLFENLSEAQRTEGFLSAVFSAVHWLRMSTDLGIDAAFDGEQLAGYLCAFRGRDTPRPPVIEAMLAAFPDIRFEGGVLDAERSYIYGPVCIAHGYRGSGVLARLFAAQCERLAAEFPMGAAFIAERNTRSLRAHTHKLGMRRVGGFQCDGAGYHIVAFRTDRIDAPDAAP